MNYTKKPLEGEFGEITDKTLGIKHALYEFNPGSCLLPGFFDMYLKPILNIPVREDDVWLVSYPRTGSTWCQEMIWLIGNHLQFEEAQKTAQQLRAPLIEMSVVLYEYADQFADYFTNSVEYVKTLPSPRFIKSHLPFQLLPTEIHAVKPKIIYIIRNPKDVCVSYYHHCKLLHGFNVTFETFCDLFLNNAVAYGGIFNHYFEFWNRRHEKNLLILRYEDMKKNTRDNVQKIAEFMEKSLTEGDVNSIVEFLQFHKMKENKGCNFEKFLDKKLGMKHSFKKMGTHFIRKGEIGDWKNHMSPEMSDKFDKWIEVNTMGTDLNMGVVKKSDELDEILNRDFTTVFREGYINVKGVTMPKRFEEMEKEIYDWDVTEEDVWICSFPKTGTTWVQEMVWMIMHDLDFEEGRINLGARSPFLEVSALFDYRKFRTYTPDFEPPPFIEDSLNFVRNEAQKGPVCIKTHLPWVLLPREIQDNTRKPKIIYVTRNPKDTCISYYNHGRLLEGYKGNFEDFCKLFLAGKLNFAPYWDHILPFWHRRHQANILFLKYEEMIKDLPAIIRKVASILEKPLSDDQIELLSKHLSFSSMKANPAVNYELIVGLNRKFNIIDCEGTFMRSGKIGDYKAKMSSDTIKKFDEWTEENTRDTEFSF